MSILKPKYELSVWKEILDTENGTKTEIKEAIIGADDMSALGRATNVQLKRELKGTNTLTFQMPSKFFDSQKGQYIHNELTDYVFNERKIKLKFNDEWYEFYVKKIDEKKNYKSIIYNYTCNDAFIDELSRNGYGITFDTELYNNVEEIGNFTNKILEDGTIWKYDASKNIGDFTEFNEEKLYKIPLSCFPNGLDAYPINLNISQETLTNPYTKETRQLQMGDDRARELSYFWDNKKGDDKNDVNCLTHSRGFTLFDENNKQHFSNSRDYIYVPYNMLNYIYGHTSDNTDEGQGTEYRATATPLLYDNNNPQLGYALRTFSNDYTDLIEFIYIPKEKNILIDENGLIINTDIQYVMTVGDWNNAINSQKKLRDKDNIDWSFVRSEGYLESINDIEIKFGKNISVTNRTEVNVSEEIDRYTTVYNNRLTEFIDLWTNENFINLLDNNNENAKNIYDNLWVCSYPTSRSIVPQLARNLIQNGNNITATDGWEVMKVSSTPTSGTTKILAGVNNTYYYNEDTSDIIATQKYYTIKYKIGDVEIEFKTYANNIQECQQIIADFQNYINNNLTDIKNGNFLKYVDELSQLQKQNKLDDLTIDTGNFSYDSHINNGEHLSQVLSEKSTETGLIIQIPNIQNNNINGTEVNYILINPEVSIINFGIVGQEITIEKHKMYAFRLVLGTNQQQEIDLSKIIITIGNGNINGEGYYSFEYDTCVQFTYADYLSAIGKNSTNNIYDNYLLLAFANEYDNPYMAITFPTYDELYGNNNVAEIDKVIEYKIITAEFFEAYTRGFYGYEPRALNSLSGNINQEDIFLTIEDAKGYLKYLYTGRDFNYNKSIIPVLTTNNLYYSYVENDRNVLKETDISLGEVFEYERYYSQCLKFKPYQDENNKINDYLTFKDYGYLDTFKLKSFINDEYNTDCDIDYMKQNPFVGLNAAHYTDDDYEIITNYLNLNKCSYYENNNLISDYLEHGDCKHPKCKDGICLYQKSGYCPYRFQTEKHCRRIRTLSGEKSNRFNLIQETSKVFEVYPNFYIDHDVNTGKIKRDENGNYIKRVFYMTEKGMENKLGFRYEKNLKDISRSIDSNSIVTKLYVEDVDSELSDTGLCSIKTAEDNPSKDSFLIDFSYYEMKGLMNQEETETFLYGNGDKKGYLKELGNLNEEYDQLSNLIINMQDESYTELQANIEVNLTGIETALTELNKNIEKINKYYKLSTDTTQNVSQSDTYNNYVTQFVEQLNILAGLIASTFGNTQDNGEVIYNFEAFTNREVSGITIPNNITIYLSNNIINENTLKFLYGVIMDYNNSIYNSSWRQFREKFLDNPKNFPTQSLNYGLFGQYVSQYLKIQDWKKERSQYLVQINKLSQSFYHNYEPFLKEGTWTDSNYLSDNTYYWGAKSVIQDGCKPKITYNISVIDLYNLPNHEDYKFNLGDTTYVEDIETFGVNQKTGLPNKIKVLISSITYNLDNPTSNSIGVQNYTTQFEDLFGQISASVQSLNFNENTYKRASNFTATKNVEGDSLQGALDENQLTLMDTDESNIIIDTEGQSGSDINNHAYQYKLTGEGLFFSKNGGQSWDVGVTPKGINADYIKVGSLDASKVQIIDGEYLYFLWDKTGITAYRDPKLTNTENKELFGDFARFNKYGLSIVENNIIKLRAGYEFVNGSPDGIKGDIRQEAQSIASETPIGFYLYDNEGNVILNTNTNANENNDISARLSLQGEIYVTDKFQSDNSTGQIINRYYWTPQYQVPASQALKILFVVTSNNYTIPNTFQLSSETYVGQYAIQDIDNSLKLYELKNISITHDNATENLMVKNDLDFSKIKAGDIIQVYKNTNTKISIIEKATNYTNKISVSKNTTFAEITNGYIQINENILKIEKLYRYYIDSYIYYGTNDTINEEQEYIPPIGPQEINGNVGLYINNLPNQIVEGADDSTTRLFCIAVDENSGQTKNTFTIFKDGSCYFGGTINTNSGAAKLPATGLIISNSKINIKSDGNLYINFSDIKSMDENESLEDYIEGIAKKTLEKAWNQTYEIIASAGVQNHTHDCFIDSKTTTVLDSSGQPTNVLTEVTVQIGGVS